MSGLVQSETGSSSGTTSADVVSTSQGASSPLIITRVAASTKTLSSTAEGTNRRKRENSLSKGQSADKLASRDARDAEELTGMSPVAASGSNPSSDPKDLVAALSHEEKTKKLPDLSAHPAHLLPKPKETRSVSVKATNMIPDPAISLSASRPTMLPPPRPSTAASSFVNSTPTLTPGSSWGPSAASAAAARAEAAEPGRIGDLKRFTLWETKTRFYLVAYNTSQTRFRILKVDRTPPIASETYRGAEENSTTKSEPATGPKASTSDDATSRGPSAKAKDSRLTQQKRGKNVAQQNRTEDPSDCSVYGQSYLSVDDPQIPLLNRQLLDAKQNDISNKEAGVNSSSMQGSKPTVSNHRGSIYASGAGTENLGDIPSSRKAAADVQSAASQGPFPENFSSTKAQRTSQNASSAKRNADWELSVTSDRVVYSRTQVAELLEMIREGNRATGGLREIGRFFGIVGFIRFTGTYYMVLISRRSVVALIGGHYIHHCDETVIIPVCHSSVLASLPGRTKLMEQEEARLLHLFKQVDLSKNFYFSYTYDLTKTLQDNLTSSPEEPSTAPHQALTAWGYNEKFIWNHHLLLPAFGAYERQQPGEDARNEWVLPLIYGFVDQAKLSVLNRTVYVTLIARRSRHFAGARFLKRGINERGHVANDVETEQIVSDALTTAFFAPGHRRKKPSGNQHNGRTPHTRSGTGIVKASGLREKPGVTLGTTEGNNDYLSAKVSGDDEEEDDLPYEASPRYTSYVMMRGSIPVYWTQDSTNMSPRPPIEISLVDPYYSAAALHFDDLFHRYGTPVIVLNLIKSKEKQEREVKLLRAFGECVEYLNQFLPTGKKIKYIAWDMSRASKAHDQDVIGVLEDIAEETVETTRFFHSGPEPSSFGFKAKTNATDSIVSDEEERLKDLLPSTSRRRESILLQEGVARVNCVDCLDRTNAAQFVIGKAAFGHQLHALGLLDDPSLPFDSDAVNMLTEMYHDQGDTIAMQYGGSALAHTTDTYRKINQWTSHSRDVLETMKRYYANSFADADKQAAINLFLGVDPTAPDFSPQVFPKQLAQSHTDSLSEKVPFRPHYQHWYNPDHLQSQATIETRQQRLTEVVNADAGFWAEYYRPSLFTDLHRHHAFKMTAVHQAASGPSAVPHTTTSGILPNSASTGSLQLYSPQIGSVTSTSRHARSDSTSSVPVRNDRSRLSGSLVEFSSPFKPHGASSRRSSMLATAGSDPISCRRSFALDRGSPETISRRSKLLEASTLKGTQHLSSNIINASSTSELPPSQAIFGGVRRWMSINHPNPQMSDTGSEVSRRNASRRFHDNEGRTAINARGKGGAGDVLIDTSSGPKGLGDNGNGCFDPRTFNFAGRWQTLNPAVPIIAGANVPIDAALKKALNPQVSVEEESEYASYTTQFMDQPGRKIQRRGSLISHSGVSDLLASGGAPRLLSSDNYMIDDKDIQIYEDDVGVSADSVLRPSTVDPALLAYVNSVSHTLLTAPSLPISKSAQSNQIPTAPIFASAAGGDNGATSSFAVSEAKIRAYGTWLSMGQSKLASF